MKMKHRIGLRTLKPVCRKMNDDKLQEFYYGILANYDENNDLDVALKMYVEELMDERSIEYGE